MNMFLIQIFLIALVGGLVLLFGEVIGDRFQLCDSDKIILILGVYILIIGSAFLVGYGGLMLLGKTIVNIVIFFTLLFLPVTLYKYVKNNIK